MREPCPVCGREPLALHEYTDSDWSCGCEVDDHCIMFHADTKVEAVDKFNAFARRVRREGEAVRPTSDYMSSEQGHYWRERSAYWEQRAEKAEAEVERLKKMLVDEDIDPETGDALNWYRGIGGVK